MSFNRRCSQQIELLKSDRKSLHHITTTDERLTREASSVESLNSDSSLYANHHGSHHDQNKTLLSTMTSLSDNVTAGRISHWAVSFDKLLEDELGVKYFKAFLRKEFSEENILFWKACEKLRTSTDEAKMKADIVSIYDRFLAPDALMSVNIDSQGQQLAEEALTSSPNPNIFSTQQEQAYFVQIYTLMRLDSYSRFIKSSFYRHCVVKEMEGDPHPLESVKSGDIANGSFREVSKSFDAGIARRKSKKDKGPKKAIFSFKNRSKSQRASKFQEPWNVLDNDNQVEDLSGPEPPFAVSRASSLPGNSLIFPDSSKVCHVTWWDHTSTVMFPKNGDTIREALDDVCVRKGVKLYSIDVYFADEYTEGSDGKPKRPISLDLDASILASESIIVERKSVFRLDLLSVERSVGVKAPATKSIAEVLQPVLEKYNLKLEDFLVKDSIKQNELLLHEPVSTLDGLRIIVEEKPSTIEEDDDQQRKQRRKDATTKQRKKQGNVAQDIGETEALFDLMTSLQAWQLDDQRGLISEVDLELPEFLKLKPININSSNNVVYDVIHLRRCQ